MIEGFFISSEVSKQPKINNRILRCGACGLSKKTDSPKVKSSGDFEKKIMVVIESPGEDSRQSIVVSGRAGFRLRRTFRKFGIDLLEDCLITSSIKCHPDSHSNINMDTAAHCQPALLSLIKEKKPRVILTVGNIATLSLLKTIWQANPGGLDRWVGTAIPHQKWNCWICPTYDPYILEMKNHPILDKTFNQHIKNAIDKAKKRPWKKRPNYIKKIRIIFDPAKTASVIYRNMKNTEGHAAFDFETNRLKPDPENARIVSMSICFRGKKTIAFPWTGEAIIAAKKFLRSPIKKIAANMKFEERWTREICGFSIRRLVWDTMIAEHIMDNRPGICGLKFQSFVYLGMPVYDDHVSSFLTSDKPDGTNRIDEIDLKELLLYNGLDSALTYDIAMMQMKYLRKGNSENV